MKADKVIDTFMGYLQDQMVPSMTNAQEFAFYAFWESIRDEADTLVSRLTSNPLTRAIIAIDKDGEIDTDKLVARLRKTFERQERLSLEVPFFGTVCFNESDLTAIEARLRGGST